MADESEHTAAPASGESLLDKIAEKIHGHHDSSSSSDSDSEKKETSSIKEKVFRLFGREKPVHSVLGGGKRMNFSLSLSLSLSFSLSYGHCLVYLSFR